MIDESSDRETVSIQRIASGGEGVGHLTDGRVVFVTGALPGDTATVALVQQKKRFARARILEILEASPHRIEPDCSHVADGCGGCDWRHVQRDVQSDLKAQIVRDSLMRIGRLTNPVVSTGPSVLGDGRTTVRAIVRGGRAGYRQRRSHRAVLVESCSAAHPLAEEIIIDGRFGDAAEITIRVGARTGERLVVVDPTVEDVDVPEGALVVGSDDLVLGHRVWINEVVGGRDWRISAGSFFQTMPEGAEALARLVKSAVETAPEGPLVDLYSGGGLFAGLCAGGRQVTAIESSASSVADARVNIPEARILELSVENWQPQPASVVIADPARAGLGANAVEIIAATMAPVVVLVSCDPGSLGRDASLLVDAGYGFEHATTIDMFPNTSHIETVSLFRR